LKLLILFFTIVNYSFADDFDLMLASTKKCYKPAFTQIYQDILYLMPIQEASFKTYPAKETLMPGRHSIRLADYDLSAGRCGTRYFQSRLYSGGASCVVPDSVPARVELKYELPYYSFEVKYLNAVYDRFGYLRSGNVEYNISVAIPSVHGTAVPLINSATGRKTQILIDTKAIEDCLQKEIDKE